MTRNFSSDGSPFSITKLRTFDNAHEKEGVADGCAGSTGAGSFETDVASGEVVVNNTKVSVTSKSGISHSTSGNEDRIDLVTVNSSDTKNVVEGSQASTSGQPNAPDIPSDEVVLYLVEVRAGSSEILSGDIYNEYKTFVKTYLDSSGTFYAYGDLGSGADWHSVPPAQVLEEASTFTESDITITHNNTSVANGSIELMFSATTRPDDNSSTSSNAYVGETINPNQDIDRLEAELSENMSGVGTLGVYKTDGTVLDEDSSVSSAGDVASLNPSSTLSSGTDYNILAHNGGSSYTFGFENDNHPYTGTTLDLTAAVKGSDPGSVSDTGQVRVIDNVAASDATSGDALVAWDTGVPNDIKSWDLATFQTTLNNETVDIDVEDSNGNVLFSDIGQNFDISTVDTSKDVQLRANLSRNNTANNPTVDYLARRFVR